MKKLLFVLAFVFALTGCEGQGSDAIQPLQYTEEYNFTQLSDSDGTLLQRYVRQADITDLLSEMRIEQLAQMGISVSAQNISLVSNGQVDFDLVLNNPQGKTLTLPMEAVVNYYITGNGIKRIHIMWGNISAENSTPVLCTLNHIYTIDAEKLTLKQLSPQFLADKTQRYYLLDAIACDAGYTAAYMDSEKQGYIVFDKTGKTTDEYYRANFFAYYNDSSSSNYSFEGPGACIATFYVDPQQTIIGRSKEETAYHPQEENYAISMYSLADLASDLVEFYPFAPFDYQCGDCRVAMFSPGNYNTFRVVRAKNGRVTDYFTFDGSSLHETFRNDYQDEFIIDSDENCDVVTVYSIYSGQLLEIDFTDYTVDVSSEFTENWQYTICDTDKTGRYRLCAGGRYGGGDVSYTMLVLKDTHTGWMKYIDTIGGMYGGGEDAGFFSNGDVYTISRDEFKVFTTDMSQQGPVFEMSKNFPLGYEISDEIYFRHLLGARRDPQTHSWVVLYNESGPYSEDGRDYYIDGDDWGYYKSTYKIGILDPQGRLTQVYDTGEYVHTYNFTSIDMYMIRDNVIRFEVLQKGEHPILRGEVDLVTGRYTNISGGYNNLAK